MAKPPTLGQLVRANIPFTFDGKKAHLLTVSNESGIDLGTLKIRKRPGYVHPDDIHTPDADEWRGLQELGGDCRRLIEDIERSAQSAITSGRPIPPKSKELARNLQAAIKLLTAVHKQVHIPFKPK